MAGPVKISSDASSEKTATVQKKNFDGTTDINPVDSSGIPSTSNSNSRQELPVSKNKGQINWLGSSYTGQDIKVVAHLYDDASEDVENLKTKLENRQTYLNSIINGSAALSSAGVLENILANSDSFDEAKIAIEKTLALGPSPEEQEAKRALLNIALYNPKRETPLDSSASIASLKNLQQNAKVELESISNRQKELDLLAVDAYTTVVLGTLQTLSVQSAREKYAVRSLGHSYAKAYTRGTRTLAGSMIFTVFEEHPLSKLIRAMGNSDRWSGAEIATLLPDQIPPIDITIVFANEYGSVSEQRLYGVEFVNDSTTYSIENLLTEQVMQFTCRDIDVLTSKGLVRLSNAQRFDGDTTELSGSRLLSSSEEYSQYLQRLGIRRRLTNR